ncbi:MAG: CvpA family protein [Caldisericaceae bacterium]|nr:CvpA family protein [Caldisericaceae bacterium]RLD20517.1 MAG: hypothetical protein DRI33_01185 [Caldisericota bacterium]
MSGINYVDVVIFILLLIAVVQGIRKGVVIPVFDIVGLVAGWFIAKTNAFVFGIYLDGRFNMGSFFYDKVFNIVKLPPEVGSLPADNTTVINAIKALHFPSFLQNLFFKGTIPSGFTVQQFLASRISQSIVTGIAFLIILLGVFILFRIAGIIVRRIVRVSPFLKWFDSFFGALLKFVFIYAIIFIIIQVVLSAYGYLHLTESAFFYQIETSKFYTIGVKIFPIIKEKIILLIVSAGQ